MARRYLGMQWAEWQALDARIAELEEDIKAQVKQDESARRLTGIKGVGPLIASAAAAMVGNGLKLQAWASLCGQSGAGAQRAFQWRSPTAGRDYQTG